MNILTQTLGKITLRALAQERVDLNFNDFGPVNVQTVEGEPAAAVGNVLSYLLNLAPYFLGGLAFLAILYSGAMYVLAFGDPTKMETAKKNLTWTIIGIVAVAGVYIMITLAARLIKGP